MLFGALNLSLTGYIIATIIFTQLTIFAVTIYLHRCQSHCALTLHPIVSHFFRLWLWLTTGMVTKEWVAIHRKHHAKTETSEDPHSPQIHGIKKVLLEGTELYRAEAANAETIEKYGMGTPDDWIERHVYTRWSQIGIFLMFIINVYLFGVPGVTIWAIQMMWIPITAAGIINGIGHYFGYRNYESQDASRNIVPWGLIIGGEELHNNHHTFANSAKLSSKWWEVDIGWGMIKLLSLFKLARVRKLPPVLGRTLGKLDIDNETLKALLANRLQILAEYTRDVMIPVWKAQKLEASGASRRALQRVKSFLVRDPKLLTQSANDRLREILTTYADINLVYEYRSQLQALWQRSSANSAEHLAALQKWCRQAEASGNEALQRFVKKMAEFTPVYAIL